VAFVALHNTGIKKYSEYLVGGCGLAQFACGSGMKNMANLVGQFGYKSYGHFSPRCATPHEVMTIQLNRNIIFNRTNLCLVGFAQGCGLVLSLPLVRGTNNAPVKCNWLVGTKVPRDKEKQLLQQMLFVLRVS
jgi:hypothetical protein